MLVVTSAAPSVCWSVENHIPRHQRMPKQFPRAPGCSMCCCHVPKMWSTIWLYFCRKWYGRSAGFTEGKLAEQKKLVQIMTNQNLTQSDCKKAIAKCLQLLYQLAFVVGGQQLGHAMALHWHGPHVQEPYECSFVSRSSNHLKPNHPLPLARCCSCWTSRARYSWMSTGIPIKLWRSQHHQLTLSFTKPVEVAKLPAVCGSATQFLAPHPSKEASALAAADCSAAFLLPHGSPLNLAASEPGHSVPRSSRLAIWNLEQQPTNQGMSTKTIGGIL